jgi:DNA polymerase-1
VPVRKARVQGDEVRLVVLPTFNDAAVKAWAAFVDSDEIFGLDVESTAIPAFEGARKMFSPALARPKYVVPNDISASYVKRGFVPGETREIKVRTIQFANTHEAWVLDVEHPKWRPLVVGLLSKPDKRFVSHNSVFDATRVQHEFGIRLGTRSIDTLPMCGLLWPGQTAPTSDRGKGLKEVCEWVLADDGLVRAEKALHARFADLYYTRTAKLPKSFVPGTSPCRNCKDEPSWKGSGRGFGRSCYIAAVGYTQTVEEWGWDNIEIDDPVFTAYAGLDALFVRRLLPRLAEMLKAAKMSTLSQREQRIKRLMVGTTNRGHRVDMDWTTSVLDEVTGEWNEAVEETFDRTGLKVRSPKMRDWLAERGCRTRSLDKKHLPELLMRHGDDPEIGPVLRCIETYSTHDNLIKNLTVILRHAEGGEGVIHPQINTIQAHTGRMSIQGPAMQTLAKDGLKGERLRGCFIAREGHVFVGADYDNQETRIAAALSGDEALNRIVAENLNQHVLTAEAVFAEYVSKTETPEIYKYAKNLDFAQQYGAMPKKIAAMSGMTLAQATTAWEAWRRTYSGLVEWTDSLAKRSHIRNPFGRVIPAVAFGRAYANGNYMIQSTGRDLLGCALSILAEMGLGSKIWLPVHDEIVLEVPEDKAETAAQMLGEAMTMHLPGGYKVDVPFPATGEVIGARWKGLG